MPPTGSGRPTGTSVPEHLTPFRRRPEGGSRRLSRGATSQSPPPITDFRSLVGLDMCEKRQAFRDVAVAVRSGSGPGWWSITGQPVYDMNARFKGYRGIGSDITEARRSESKIQFLATHDSLTGLPNRSRFITELEAFCLKAASPDVERHGAGERRAVVRTALARPRPVQGCERHLRPPTGDACSSRLRSGCGASFATMASRPDWAATNSRSFCRSRTPGSLGRRQPHHQTLQEPMRSAT